MDCFRRLHCLLREVVHGGNPVHLEKVYLKMVKSGYVRGGYTPTSEDYKPRHGIIQHIESSQFRVQRVYATSSFGSSKTTRFSSVTILGGGEHGEEVLVEQCLAVFHLHLRDGEYNGRY